MILIFGGAYQGKTEFAKHNFNIADDDIHFCSEDRGIPHDLKAYCNLENVFLNLVKQDIDVVEALKAHRDDFQDKIIIVNDISQGIVPMDKTLRAWREATGRAMAYLAGEAEQVYRVFCGIGLKIK